MTGKEQRFMDLAAIKELAWQSMGERITHPQREKGFIYYHGQRVAAIALQLRSSSAQEMRAMIR